jgi:hypothetical protein
MVDSNDEIIQEGFWDVASQQRLVIEQPEAEYEYSMHCPDLATVLANYVT